MKNPLNQKCGCGSGRKARYCCKTKEASSRKNELLERQIKQISKKLPRLINAWVLSSLPYDKFEQAWLDFSRDEGDPEPAEEFFPVFIPWLFFHWYPAGKRAADTLSHKYLKVNRGKLSDIERKYIEAGQKSPLRFLQVAKKNPDNLLDFKDVLLSTAESPVVHTCFDKSLSKTAPEGTILLGQILSVAGFTTLESIAPFPIDIRFISDLYKFRDVVKDECGGIDLKILKRLESRVIDLYWDLAHAQLAPPILQNTSGEDLAFQQLVYEIEDSGAVIRELSFLTHDSDEQDYLCGLVEAGKHLSEATEFVWASEGINPKLGGRTTLGFITIKGQRLTVKVNSFERSEEIKEIIAKRLGPQVKLLVDVIDGGDLGSMISQPGKAAQSLPPMKDLPPEVIQALEERGETMRAQWFNTKIPMLDNMTPREAAKSPKGMELLEALITYYDRPQEKSDQDFLQFNPTGAEIRQELGI